MQRLLLLTAAASLLLPAAAAQDPAPEVDFGHRIRPLLSDRCFPCHGPDEAARRRTGGLRLDRREDATRDLGGYAAIAPGSPEESELLLRVRSAEDHLRMPPPESKLELTEEEIALLEQWIREGAEYEQHWAFVPPSRHPAPDVRRADWARDPLDDFLLARMEAAGLEPAPDAAPELLLRRASLDLTGLPPTPEELDAFLADARPDAYERAVDRLLASPRYGERMAADWLDVARYADSYGYQNDVARRVWPWRDWVVEAFNANLPYDRFVTWQLAGDLLPEPTREQRLATTFNRLHRQTNEGGSVEEEFRVEYVADRVSTAGTAFLGLTLECARCHDHKFDPVSQEEFFGLFAFFQNIDESGLYSHFTPAVPTPALLLTTDEDEAALARLRADVAAREGLVDVEAVRAEYLEWLAGEAAPAQPDLEGRYTFEPEGDAGVRNHAAPEKPGALFDGPARVAGPDGTTAVRLSGDDGVRFPGVGEFRRTDAFTLALRMKVPESYERAVVLHRSRAWTDAASQGYQLLIEDGRLSAALVHFWPGDAAAVRARDPLPVGEWVDVALTYDGSGRAAGLALYVDGERAPTDVVRDDLTKSLVQSGGLVLTLGERFRDRGLKGGEVAEVQVFRRRLGELEVRELARPGTLARALEAPGAADDPALLEHYAGAHSAAHRGRLEELRAARAALADRVDAVPSIMTMAELPAPRPAYLLRRGRYDARGPEVDAHVPAVLGALPEDARRDRLGLARWLTRPDHPLTARVAVNRLWQLAFGRGLVETSENFGSQGTPPSHPELLDVLALDFVASGWDTKAMLRRLVTSRAYRQSSRASETARERDPENRLLSHAPRPRLSAEMVRDAALHASGLLVERRGGPGTKPYQPAGLWKEKSGQVYVPDEGEGVYRRSLYTFWKRTSPPPNMRLFDAAKRDVCTARREARSTPLQALVLWNDPQLVEAARVLAQRELAAAGPDDPAWIRRAFRRATAREPDARELELLTALFRDQREAYAEAPDRAAELLTVGRSAAEGDPADVAAGTLVVSAIFSYDSFLFRR